MSQNPTETGAAAVPPPRPRKHMFWEDVQGLVTAVLVASLGVAILKAGHLVTGGMAGVGLLGNRVTGWPFGWIFFCANLPFYWLAIKRMGWEFTLKTFGAVLAVGFVADHLSSFFSFSSLSPAFAAVYGGVLCGIGILMLVRHRASLGGLNVLVFYLQETRGWPAGKVQMVFDVGLMVLAFVLLHDPVRVGYSVLGVVALNLVLWFNHRPDRYLTK